jgi:hypothetical protein
VVGKLDAQGSQAHGESRRELDFSGSHRGRSYARTGRRGLFLLPAELKVSAGLRPCTKRQTRAPLSFPRRRASEDAD